MSREDPMMIRARDIREGDVLDLEGDPFADCPLRDHTNTFEFEYQEVHEVTEETPNCILIGGDGWLVGFPPDHRIAVVKRTSERSSGSGALTPTPLAFEQGFRIMPRATFLTGTVEIAAFLGATSMTPDEIAVSHTEVLADMRDRIINQMPQGRYVIYDPNADAEGWMLVGDDPQALYAETEQMLRDLGG